MDKPPKVFFQVIDFMGDIAGRLDSTGWLILATCSVIAGYALLKGPGIRGG